jgi:FkbM family methyltransferase
MTRRPMTNPPSPWLALGAVVVRRLPRAKYRAMNWLARRARGPAFEARLPGSSLTFACDLRNALAREVFFTGRYEPQETDLIGRMLGPGGVFVDVGAHWGYFSLLAADRVGPSGRIVAVEADPRIHAILADNFARNHLDRAVAVAVHAAAADRVGSIALAGFDEGQDNWGLSRVVEDSTQAGAFAFEVPARPLDDLLDEHGVEAVDLLKMDIEGAEALAVPGMRRGLASGRYRRLLIELHPQQLRSLGADPEAVVAPLLESGYRGWTIDHSPELFRRAAYGRPAPLGRTLRPFDPDEPLDIWPHQIWEAPGVAPLISNLES